MLHDLFLATIVGGQFSFFGHPLTINLSGYGVTIVLASVVLYSLYIRRIFTRETPPPISTWGLWLLLDVVATCAELARGVFNVQLVAYTIGTFVICAVLWKRRNAEWDERWDSASATFVVMSLAVWFFTDSATVGLVMSLIGMTVASVPLIKAIVEGADEPAIAWAVAVAGSILGYLDGNVLSGVWLGLLQFLTLCLVLVMARQRNAHL